MSTLPKAQQGFSLIEVMVSMFVLGIGLLGLGIMQATALRHSHSSYQQHIATAQVYAMIDRMRANQAAVGSGSYNAVTGIPSDPNCSSCSSAEMAQRDGFEWNTSNAALLPSGQGTVTANGNLHTVTIMWDSRRTGATGTNCSGNPNVDLTCQRVEVRL